MRMLHNMSLATHGAKWEGTNACLYRCGQESVLHSLSSKLHQLRITMGWSCRLGSLALHMQGPAGCMATAWRLEPGGYLRHILNARVYDIAVSPCPLAAPWRLFRYGFRVSMRQARRTRTPVCAVVHMHCSLRFWPKEAPAYLFIHMKSCVTP